MSSLSVLVSLTILGCHSNDTPHKPPLVVFAAASLQDVVKDLGQLFAQDQHVELVYNFAGSNTLAQQIKAAPAADVFLSANVEWVNFLEQADRLVEGTRRNVVSNRLVLISRHDAPFVITDPYQLAELDFSFLALANPDAVPAGRYAKAFLQSVKVGDKNLWEIVKDKIAPTADVRAALGLVESDPAIIGMVYRTDAALSSRVTVQYEVPAQLQQPIMYTAAVVKGRHDAALARRFLNFLGSPQAKAVFTTHGFVTDAALDSKSRALPSAQTPGIERVDWK
jgi:molybdate transport system substrate-binding protein